MNIPIYKKERYLELLKAGFECVAQAPNYKVKGQTVFYFEKTDELLKKLKEISLSNREIFKIKNPKVAHELVKVGYELVDWNSNKTDGKVHIFKWTPNIYEDTIKIMKKLNIPIRE